MNASRCLVALAFTVAWLRPGSARAGDATLAEALFRDGRTLMDAKDYAHACPKLAESFRQDPATGTELALAICYEESGRLASAWTTYTDVAARSRQEGRADRADAASERADKLEPRLSKLTVNVAPAVAALPGLVVKCDGFELPAAAWGSAVPQDPGEHSIEATAPGKLPFRSVVPIGVDGDAKDVTVTELDDAPPAAPPVALPAPAPPPPSRAVQPVAPAAEPGSSGSLRTTGFVLGGAGVVALGVGAVFGLRAGSLNGQSNADGHCTNGCDAKGLRLRNDALSAADVSTVLFVAGGALLATGVVLYLVGEPSSAEAKSASTASFGISALASPTNAELRLFGTL